MPRRLLFAIDVVLIVVAGVLGVQLYRAWTAAPATAPTPPAAATAADPPPTPTPPVTRERPPFSTFAVVAERNLFSPTRTEAPPEPSRTAAGASPTPAAPRPRLYGIALLPDGKARAYLEDVQRRKVFGYEVGDSVADSRVEQIKADRVVLRRGNEVFEVLLRDPSKPKPATPPQVVPSRPTPPTGVPTPGQPAVPPGGFPPSGAPGVPVPAPAPGRPAPGTSRRPPINVPGAVVPPPRPETQDPGSAPAEDEGS